ncbi:DUF2971 domain-containing protein [Rhodococcus erythropolis]
MTESNTIWHYTDAAGLLGILGSNPAPRKSNLVGPQSCSPEFRATAVEYLNDSRELIHGLGILKNEVLVKKAEELDNYKTADYHEIANAPAKAKFIRSLCETIESVEKRTYSSHIHCYVTSFSEKRDALSQWRGYCGGLDGFAIGIDKSKLPHSQEAKLKKVLYSDSLTAASEIAVLTRKWLDLRLSDTDAPSVDPGTLDKHLRELSVFATQFKHEGFEEEAEWRVIHLSYHKGGSYRSRGAQLIPYTTWSLPADAVVGVRVGPGPNQHENYLAAQGALHALGYASDVVANLTKSPTPFR